MRQFFRKGGRKKKSSKKDLVDSKKHCYLCTPLRKQGGKFFEKNQVFFVLPAGDKCYDFKHFKLLDLRSPGYHITERKKEKKPEKKFGSK